MAPWLPRPSVSLCACKELWRIRSQWIRVQCRSFTENVDTERDNIDVRLDALRASLGSPQSTIQSLELESSAVSIDSNPAHKILDTWSYDHSTGAVQTPGNMT